MRLLLLIFLLCTWAVSAKTITDITGQRIEIPDNPQRIVLGESRMLYTLALLEPGYRRSRGGLAVGPEEIRSAKLGAIYR